MHPLLVRQLLRTNTHIPDNMKSLFELISVHYFESGNSISLLENALEVSSTELTELNQKLRNKAEVELANQRTLLHDLINVIPDLIFIKNINGLYVGCNKAFQNIFNASENEIVGKSDMDFPDSNLARVLMVNETDVYSSGTSCVNEEWVCHSNGAIMCLEFIKTPYIDSQCNVVGLIGIGRDITERKRTQEALESSGRTFREIIQHSPIGMGVAGLDGRFIQVNQSLCRLLGYSREELEQLTTLDITHPDDKQKDRFFKEALLSGDFSTIQNTKRILRKNGEVVWINISVALHRDNDGSPLYFIGQIEDITEKRASQLREHYLSTVLENVFDGVITITSQGTIESFNKAAQNIFGYSEHDVVGKNVSILMPEPYQASHDSFLRRYLNTREKRIIGQGRELLGVRRDGSTFPLDIAVSELVQTGEIRFIGVLRDISDRKRAEERVLHLAHYDALTDLPNRTLLDDRLAQALLSSKREARIAALLFIDLDKFKPVNDEFGHHIGDSLLVEVANRLKGCIRDSDTASRLGGDEFVVLLPSVIVRNDALLVAEKILDQLNQPFLISNQAIRISASIGVAFSDSNNCQDGPGLLKCADSAMYEAKSQSQINIAVY